MLFPKIRTKFDINFENVWKTTIQWSTTYQNEKTTAMVRKIAPNICWEISNNKNETVPVSPEFDFLSDETP